MTVYPEDPLYTLPFSTRATTVYPDDEQKIARFFLNGDDEIKNPT
jgi:hypothetical protein